MAAGEKYLTGTEATTLLYSAFKNLSFSSSAAYLPFSIGEHRYLSLFNSDGTYAATGLSGIN